MTGGRRLVLTPHESLARKIAADSRNIESWRERCDMQRLAKLPYIIADCARRFVEAKQIARDTGDHELLRAAEHNLTESAAIWAAHNP